MGPKGTTAPLRAEVGRLRDGILGSDVAADAPPDKRRVTGLRDKLAYNLQLDRTPVAALVGVAAVFGISAFQLLTIRDGQDWGPDFAQYIHHARNIAAGIPYADIGYIYNPDFPALSPKAYPPMFPLLLAPVYAAFGTNLTAMKVVVIASFIASLVVLWLLFRREMRRPAAVIVIAALAFNPFLCVFKNEVRSDFPFLFFVALALLLMQRRPRRPGPLTTYAIGLGAVIYLAVATRSFGLVLVPTLLAADLIRSRAVSRATAIALGTLVCLSILQGVAFGTDRSYLDQLPPTWHTVSSNAESYWHDLWTLWWNGYSDAATTTVWRLIGVLAILGYAVRIWQGLAERRPLSLELFLIFYVALALAWPGNQGLRFLIPVIPLYVFFAFEGGSMIGRLMFRRRGEIAAVVMLGAVIFASYAGQYTRMDLGPITPGVTQPESSALFEFINGNTRPSDVLVFRKPQTLTLFTGRPASVFHKPREGRELWAYLTRIQARYIVLGPQGVEPEDQAFLRRFIDAYRHRMRKVFVNRSFTVYRVAAGAAMVRTVVLATPEGVDAGCERSVG